VYTPAVAANAAYLEDFVELKASVRTQKNSSLRSEGMLPAVVYDKGNNKSIYVERKAFDKIFRQVSTHGVITLAFDDGAKLDTLVKAVAMNKRKRVAEHADFLIVSDEPIEVVIPVHTKGVSAAVKAGGVLDIVAHNVTVKCAPKNIPQEFVIDISNVGLNQPIHGSDLVMPEGVKLVSDPKATLLVIHHARAAEEVAAPAAEPEVIAKGKKEEK
jgi:large subunit ribosomal protein L25